jgi:hypothetical protein
LNSARKIPVSEGLVLLILGIIVGIILLVFSSALDHSRAIDLSAFVQAILFLAGTLLIWYFSHPLSHYLSARAFGINTLYFYVGRTDLRNAKIAFIKGLSSKLVTIGTKLDKTQLRTSSMPRRARGFIYGSGAIFSTCLVALIFVYSIVANLNIVSIFLVFVFFAFSLGSEIFLSTKSGDLSKMKRELDRI